MDIKKIFAKKEKDPNVLSNAELRKIASENMKITKEFEKKKGRKNVPEEEYMTEMKNPANVLEIDDLHPHMFRYSHATVLHELGVDDKTIQHWEGHANQATTANIYIKNTQTMTDRAEAILSDFASANA